MDKVTGVYKLVATPNEKTIKLQHLDTIKPNKKVALRDTLVDSFYIVDERKIFVEVYACNITNHYLLQNKKQPIFCFIVKYYKHLQTRELAKIYLNFNIDDKINSEKEFLNKKINGKFCLDITIKNNIVNLDDDLTSFKNQEDMIEHIKKLLTTTNMEQYFTKLADMSDEEREKECGTEYANAKPPVVTYVQKPYVTEKNNLDKNNLDTIKEE